MSLVKLIAQADERGLAATGLACLDRCVPLLGGDDETLRPLWAGLVEGGEWGERVTKARGELEAAASAAAAASGATAPSSVAEEADDDVVALARRILGGIPQEWSADVLRAWAETSSVAALRIHQLLDPLDRGTLDSVAACREGGTEGVGHLVGSELRRQMIILELLAAHGTAGVRQALDVSTEGRRVLRAVVSRRARRR
ncbi:hypothetical protein ACWD4G_25890 [Streptomyces sp. NPDC002643]